MCSRARRYTIRRPHPTGIWGIPPLLRNPGPVEAMDMNYFNPQLDSFTSSQLGDIHSLFFTFAYGTFAVSAFFAFGIIASSAMSTLFGRSSTERD